MKAWGAGGCKIEASLNLGIPSNGLYLDGRFGNM